MSEFDDDFRGDYLLDELHNLYEIAQERGFDSITEMESHDREVDNEQREYEASVMP